MLVGFIFERRSGSPQLWRKYEVVFGLPYLLLLLSSSWQMQIDKPVRLEKGKLPWRRKCPPDK